MIYHTTANTINTADMQNNQFCYDRTSVPLYSSGPGDTQDARPLPPGNPVNHQLGGKSCDHLMSCDHHFVIITPSPSVYATPPQPPLSVYLNYLVSRRYRLDNGMRHIFCSFFLSFFFFPFFFSSFFYNIISFDPWKTHIILRSPSTHRCTTLSVNKCKYIMTIIIQAEAFSFVHSVYVPVTDNLCHISFTSHVGKWCLLRG